MSIETSDNIKISSKIDSKYRKIYRALVEKSKKLDEIYKSENAFVRIFQSETTVLRDKLKSYCEILIFREPIEFAKKAEEILWRKAFYEVINVVKLNKKSLKCNAEIETMYRMHLASAYGFYNHLLLRFQSEFNSLVHLDSFVNLSLANCFEKQTSTHEKATGGSGDLLKEVAIRILHKFLICLGDLVRYQIEYDPSGCTRLAYKYYRVSLCLLPSNGMPLNQLGTLYGSENYGCDAAYYYLYCLSCTEPFVSARENLRLVFGKNRQRLKELNDPNETNTSRGGGGDNEIVGRTKEIKRFLVSFLGTIDYVLCNSSLLAKNQQAMFEKIDNQQLQDMCQQCLQQFNACMFYNNATGSGEGDESTYLSPELVFKLTVTALISIEQIKIKKQQQQQQQNQVSKAQLNVYFILVAFVMVFFSHIVNHTIMRIEEALMARHTRKMMEKVKCKEEDDRDDDNEKADSKEKKDLRNVKSSERSVSNQTKPKNKIESTKEEADSSASNKERLHLIYGHRRRKHNSDSDTNDEDTSSSSSGSLSANDDDDDENERKVFNEYSEEDTDGDDDDDGEANRRRGRQRPRGRGRRRVNVGKFLERENLSETEMQTRDDDDNAGFSHSSTDTSSESSKSSRGANESEDGPSETGQPVSMTVATAATTSTITPCVAKPSKLENSDIVDEFPILHQAEPLSSMLNINAATTSHIANPSFFNFKELSIQLLSHFSSLSGGGGTAFPHPVTATTTFGAGGGDEFVDNEIYKFVLHGSTATTGTFMNPKEAFEIEELDKKIATFQIETDDDDSEPEDIRTMLPPQSSRHDDEEAKPAKLLDIQNVEQIIDAFESQTLLPTIKVFCDWLLCNKRIMQSISNVPTTMWSKVAILLNLIPLEKQIAKICTNEKIKALIMKSAETKTWNHCPLSEDIELRSFNGLKLEHIPLKFDVNKQNELNKWDEHLLRLCSLRRFGYLLASLSQSQANSGGVKFFEYDNKRALFVAYEQQQQFLVDENKDKLVLEKEANKMMTPSTSTQPTQNQTSSLQASLKDDRKLQLMKSMAQLRLEAEISQLESSYKTGEMPWSPYLVPDTNVLCNCLKMVQDLAKTNKSLIIIPLVVIDTLDAMKKESKLAREAIRWLENQFKLGNRFVRAQNQNEQLTGSGNSGGNRSDEAAAAAAAKRKQQARKDLDVWRFDQIVDCCCYLQQHHRRTQTQMSNSKVVSLMYDANNAYWQAERFTNAFNNLNENGIELIKVQDLWNRLSK